MHLDGQFELLFNDDTAGSVLLIDNIVFPNLLNGDFQTGSTANRRTSTTGDVGVRITDLAELTTVPEPASVLIFLASLLGMIVLGSRRRKDAALA